MPRIARVVAENAPHHVTQRGNARRTVFEIDSDRLVYLSLPGDHFRLHELALLGFCLMPNHLHLIVVPKRPGSMALVLREAHGRYAAYLNARQGASGHVWQGRYYSCPLDGEHLWRALRYTERNPVRAGLVDRAERYPWSSAAIHCLGGDCWGEIDLGLWQQRWTCAEWREYVGIPDADNDAERIRKNTHTGRPLGTEEFVENVERALGRLLAPRRGGRPQKHETEAEEDCLAFGEGGNVPSVPGLK